MQANSWHHKLFHSCSFESRNCGQEEKKFEYLENEKSFLDKIKDFEVLSFGKIKIK